jgi:hypothetical protein
LPTGRRRRPKHIRRNCLQQRCNRIIRNTEQPQILSPYPPITLLPNPEEEHKLKPVKGNDSDDNQLRKDILSNITHLTTNDEASKVATDKESVSRLDDPKLQAPNETQNNLTRTITPMFGNCNPERKEESSLTYSEDCSSPDVKDPEQEDFEFQISNGPIFLSTTPISKNENACCFVKGKRVISKVQKGSAINLNKPICSATNLIIESPFTAEVSRIDAFSPLNSSPSRNRICVSNTNFSSLSKKYTLPALEKCASLGYMDN